LGSRFSNFKPAGGAGSLSIVNMALSLFTLGLLN
jgi:hypothetical protein